MADSVNQNTSKETEVSSGPSLKPKGTNRRKLRFFFFAAGVLFIGVATLGIYTRNTWTARLQQSTNQAAQMVVQVTHPETAVAMIHLQLPGQTMPYTDAPIFAQTSGYLKKWYFDIGAKVKAGAVLAEIDTPEVDQQLAQAQAQLKVAEAARDLAQVTYERDQTLFKTNVIAAQDFDTVTDNYAGSQSTVIVDQAIVKRLEALEAFKIVRAPFDGIVTARNTDIGAFVPLGSGTQLFRMARNSPLRVYVTVPQAFSSFVKVGQEAELAVNEYPGRTFPGRVVGTAGSINLTAKRLLTELEVPNPTEELLPGTYAQVTLQFQTDNGGVMIPPRTLLFQSGAPAVGVVHPDGKVEIRKISINRDLGDRLEISKGLSASDQIIVNPSSGLTTGTVVTLAKPASGIDVASTDNTAK
jgi:membrane fusion protein, multidrug efflux system